MINLLERKIFEKCLVSPEFFRTIGYRLAYFSSGNDPEKVHERALELLNKYSDFVEKISKDFDFPNLHINIAGKNVMPFGNAEGMDKNGVVLYPLSKLFGFVMMGTVPLNAREGNPVPRVFVDRENNNAFNAQGFPSKGKRVALQNARIYRMKGGEKPLFADVCGMPASEKDIGSSYDELETLVEEFEQYSDGIVWNPFSPNTAALRILRTPEVFKRSAEIISKKAPRKLKLAKMGSYDDNEKERKNWLSLVNAFLEGGGDGIVAVNTYIVPREKIPAKKWGYPSAGVSGRFLREYRQRAIVDSRKNFGNKIFIIATGGIDSADEAWRAFEAGANALAGYTPYILNGFGLIKKISGELEEKLRSEKYLSLADFQESNSTLSFP